MSFDRKTFRRAIECSAAALPFGHEREKFLLDLLVNEAESRFNAEHAGVRNADEFNPFLEQDTREVKLGIRKRGTTEDPASGPYCNACGHYHGGMC